MAVNVTLKEYAKSIGINYECVKKRRQRGWTFEEIKLGKRPRGYRVRVGCECFTLKELSKKYSVSVNVLRSRLKDFCRVEDAIRASLKHRGHQKYVSNSN